jgi:hypothetical protein
MAGILVGARIFLRQAGVDCVLAEADRLCAGPPGTPPRRITSQHGLVYAGCCAASARKRRGCTCTPTRRRWRATAACGREIDCGFEEKDRVCLLPGRPGKAGKGACGAGEAGVPRGALRTSCRCLFRWREPCGSSAGPVRPLRFAAAAAKGCGPTSTRPCAGWRGPSAVTDRGTIRARRSSWRRISVPQPARKLIF